MAESPSAARRGQQKKRRKREGRCECDATETTRGPLKLCRPSASQCRARRPPRPRHPPLRPPSSTAPQASAARRPPARAAAPRRRAVAGRGASPSPGRCRRRGSRYRYCPGCRPQSIAAAPPCRSAAAPPVQIRLSNRERGLQISCARRQWGSGLRTGIPDPVSSSASCSSTAAFVSARPPAPKKGSQTGSWDLVSGRVFFMRKKCSGGARTNPTLERLVQVEEARVRPRRQLILPSHRSHLRLAQQGHGARTDRWLACFSATRPSLHMSLAFSPSFVWDEPRSVVEAAVSTPSVPKADCSK